MSIVVPSVYVDAIQGIAQGDICNEPGVLIPWTSFQGELAPSDIYGANPDIRKFMYVLVKNVTARYYALPATDRPKNMTFTLALPVGLTGNVVRKSYSISFVVSTDNADLVPEP